MDDARAKAMAEYRASPTVTRTFVGGCIDGEQRECRGDYPRTVRGEVYELCGDKMVYRFTRWVSR